MSLSLNEQFGGKTIKKHEENWTKISRNISLCIFLILQYFGCEKNFL